MTPGRNAVERLLAGQALTREDYVLLLTCEDDETLHALREGAVAVRKQWYQNKVYIRGLIEFTNFCKNDCYYCGIRRSNAAGASATGLTQEQVLACCRDGLSPWAFAPLCCRAGRILYFTDERLCATSCAPSKRRGPTAPSLSPWEEAGKSYQMLYDAGRRPISAAARNEPDQAHYEKPASARA